MVKLKKQVQRNPNKPKNRTKRWFESQLRTIRLFERRRILFGYGY